MPYTTKADRLQKIRDAIDAILVGGVESMRLVDHEFRALNLAQLRALEREYELEAERESRGSVALARFRRAR